MNSQEKKNPTAGKNVIIIETHNSHWLGHKDNQGMHPSCLKRRAK